MAGRTTGAPEPIAGIIGFDAFKSSVLEVGPGGWPVRLYDPETFQVGRCRLKPDADSAWFQRLKLTYEATRFMLCCSCQLAPLHRGTDELDMAAPSDGIECAPRGGVVRGGARGAAADLHDRLGRGRSRPHIPRAGGGGAGAGAPVATGMGVIQNKPSTDVESPPPPPLRRVCVRYCIHLELSHAGMSDVGSCACSQ